MIDTDTDSKVYKDMTEDYNQKVSHFLEEIDMIKQELLFDKRRIFNLNERLQTLYIKLSAKMHNDEIVKQKKIMLKLHSIKLGKMHPIMTNEGNVVDTFIFNNKSYYIYRQILEYREMHLNMILERIGLTAKEKKIGKRIR